MPSGARFCPSCGTPQLARSDERRVVTVLFADIVGFTTLAERMDPEQVKRMIDRCFERLVSDVVAYGGTVDKVLGDGIIALFGAPVAHEDDAERAVRAALAMQASLADHGDGSDTRLQMRIGIRTGEVLTGAMSGGDYTAMGDVVNTAARLQASAPPGGVLVGEPTYALTHQVIRYEPYGAIALKGRGQLETAFLATAALVPPGRHRHRTHVPLVGRDHELTVVQGAIDLAIARQRASLIAVEGEGGVGKSRLIEEVVGALRERGVRVLEGSSVPYGEANVWWPIASALLTFLDVDLSMTADQVRSFARERAVKLTGRSPEAPEMKRLEDAFLQLLGYPSPLDRLEPGRARAEVIWAVTVVLEARLDKGPFAVAVTDVHWADRAVLELFERVMLSLARRPFVLITTARPDDESDWPRTGPYSTVRLRLEPLDAGAAAELAFAILGERADPATVQRLFERSGGNPLFLEELATMLAEQPDQAATADLPDSLRAAVTARLDELPSDQRAMIDNAAVLGASGTWGQLLRFGAALNAPAEESTLHGLVGAGLLELDGRRWRFRSESVREVAYQTLTKARRAIRHVGVAQAMEQSGVARAEDIAHHLATAAEIVTELGPIEFVAPDIVAIAVRWLSDAAWQAVDQLYSQNGVRLATRALDLIGSASAADQALLGDAQRRLLLVRADGLLELRLLARAQQDLNAVMASAVEHGDDAARAGALRLRGETCRITGDTPEARRLLDASIALWRLVGNEAELARALRGRGFVEVFSGSPRDAEPFLSEAESIYRRHGDEGGLAWVEQNRAWLSFISGDIVDADERLHRAAETMSELGDRAGLGWAFGLLAWVRYFRGMHVEAETIARGVLAEALERNDNWAAGMMEALLANLSMWQGKSHEAIAHAEVAQAKMRKLGDRHGEIQVSATLLRALVAVGRQGEATKLGEEIAAHAENFGLDGFVAMVLSGTVIHAGSGRRAAMLARRALEIADVRGGLGNMDALVNLALGHLMSREVEQAVEHIGLALVAQPDSAYAHSVAAMIDAVIGDGPSAIAHAAFVAESPTHTYLDRVYALLAVAAAERQRGDLAAARSALHEAHTITAGTDDLVAQAIVLHADDEFGLAALATGRSSSVERPLLKDWEQVISLLAQGVARPLAVPHPTA